MDTDDYETYDETFEEAVPARKVSDSFEEKVEETKEEIVEAAK